MRSNASGSPRAGCCTSRRACSTTTCRPRPPAFRPCGSTAAPATRAGVRRRHRRPTSLPTGPFPRWPPSRTPSTRSRPSRSADGDRDLAADLAPLQLPHGVGRLVERVAAVQARDDLAGLDEAGEPLVVAGALLRDERHQTLTQER